MLCCAASQMGRNKPSYHGERPVLSLPLIMLWGVGKKGCSPLSRSTVLGKTDLGEEEVPALAFKLNVRTWIPVLALSPPCCATLDTQLHPSEPQLLICERQLTTSTFQGCCEN